MSNTIVNTLTRAARSLVALYSSVSWTAPEIPPPISIPHGALKTSIWTVAILICSALHFLIYFAPVRLHDISHYAVAGNNLIRDHSELIYPYHPFAPGGQGPAYEYYQNGSIHFGTRTNYPSKLYSGIYGILCALTGCMRLSYVHLMTFVTFLTGTILLYLIGRRFVKGLELVCLLLCVTCLPIMRSLVNPGNDGFGYTGSLFLLWLCLCLRINPFLLGLCAGVLTHGRSQVISTVLIFPFLYTAISQNTYFRQSFLPILGGFVLTYLTMGVLFAIQIHSNVADSNPLGFYIHHFLNTFYGPADFALPPRKFVTSVVALFDKEQLFLYPGILLLIAARQRFPLQRGLCMAAALAILLPILMYTFERFTPPVPRYFIFAIPLITLAFIIYLKTLPANCSALSSRWGMIILTVINLAALLTTSGFPAANLSWRSISSRAGFLDFEGVEGALVNTFREDDVVIINHSLPTGLSRLHNIIYVPPFDVFMKGNNRNIQGIVFVSSDTPPNDFFKPRDWMKYGVLPPSITDLQGTTFKQVYNRTSNVVDPMGKTTAEASFTIYKNISVATL